MQVISIKKSNFWRSVWEGRGGGYTEKLDNVCFLSDTKVVCYRGCNVQLIRVVQYIYRFSLYKDLAYIFINKGIFSYTLTVSTSISLFCRSPIIILAFWTPSSRKSYFFKYCCCLFILLNIVAAYLYY